MSSLNALRAFSRVAIGIAIAMLASDATARGLIPRGRYEIIITQEHADKASAPIKTEECLTKSRIENAEAFRLRSDHAIRACPISDVRFNGEELLFRIVCSEQNALTAKAKFVYKSNGYDGTITVDKGNKRKVFIEHQRAKRIGECPGDGTDSRLQIDEQHWRGQPFQLPPQQEE